MCNINDETTTAKVGRLELIRGALCRLGARHRDEAEATLPPVGIHRQVNANDLSFADNALDERLNLWLGRVIG